MQSPDLWVWWADLLSEWASYSAYGLSMMSVPYLWELGCEARPSQRLVRFFFTGSLRSVVSSELIFLVGNLVAALLAPWKFHEFFNGTALVWSIGLVLISPLFMNVKIGPVSWATRDRIRKFQLECSYREYIRFFAKDNEPLPYEAIKRRVSCMLKGVLQGNRGSARHLAELARRDDELGANVREAIAELSDDPLQVGELLGVDLVTDT